MLANSTTGSLCHAIMSWKANVSHMNIWICDAELTKDFETERGESCLSLNQTQSSKFAQLAMLNACGILPLLSCQVVILSK